MPISFPSNPGLTRLGPKGWCERTTVGLAVYWISALPGCGLTAESSRAGAGPSRRSRMRSSLPRAVSFKASSLIDRVLPASPPSVHPAFFAESRNVVRPHRLVRFARSIHQHGRDLGGPSARAAFGSGSLPARSQPKVARAGAGMPPLASARGTLSRMVARPERDDPCHSPATRGQRVAGGEAARSDAVA